MSSSAQKIGPFIDAAERAIQDFLVARNGRAEGFVASDFTAVWQQLQTLKTGPSLHGHQFMEWGSGIGAVVGIAEILGFCAQGIEIQEPLVEASCQLLTAFGLHSEIARGSLLPAEAQELASLCEYDWWEEGHDDAYSQLGVEISDMDLIYAYPWPGEEEIIDALFTEFAATGCHLLTNHGVSGFRLWIQGAAEPIWLES